MGAGRFRELGARMDALLVDRLGDRAILPDGRELFGAFAAPFVGAELGAKTGTFKIGAAINTDKVLEPTFTVRVVDAAGIEKGAFLTIDLPAEQGGGRYKINRREPDGAGMVDLLMSLSNE